MEYRVSKKTGDRISEIGIGSSYMYQAGHGSTFAIYGEAFHDVRENIFCQIHFRAD